MRIQTLLAALAVMSAHAVPRRNRANRNKLPRNNNVNGRVWPTNRLHDDIQSMEVVLSPRFVIVSKGDVVFLFGRSSEAKIWPEDVFQPYPNWGFRAAAEHVQRMALSALPKPDHRAIIDRFCSQHRLRNATPYPRTSSRSARIRSIGL